ncbi:MAG TPA: hypothetical protein VN911_11145 [Candidatus Acidoferrum sp.]|nr:hypothetical protein [Candidatus Acidoferrum sp.]
MRTAVPFPTVGSWKTGFYGQSYRPGNDAEIGMIGMAESDAAATK